MGSTQSKVEKEPMVFVNEENPVPVRISSSFANQIASSQPEAASQKDIENQVRQRVQAELARIKSEENKFADYKSDANANVTEQDMNQLAKNNPSKHVKVLPEEIVKAQDALVACYKKNTDRSLDCWAEVQEFKDLVQKAQNAFLASP
ncbi:hypothetical protein BGZ94_000517 [Podila epigama]|nr:hypothetical protein BGZ94_000517 [Podila epigama]